MTTRAIPGDSCRRPNTDNPTPARNASYTGRTDDGRLGPDHSLADVSEGTSGSAGNDYSRMGGGGSRCNRTIILHVCLQMFRPNIKTKEMSKNPLRP